MPIEVAIWRVEEAPKQLAFSSMDSEARLERVLVNDLSLVSPGLMLVGRQVSTDYGKRIDLLAMDRDGYVTVIELKRNRTSREVVAQLLDYASWVESLTYEDLSRIYSEQHLGKKLEAGFDEFFGASPPETLNESHSLVVVASELDPSSERIIDYLSDSYGVPINAVFFRYLRDGDREYLTRTWLIDPKETPAKEQKKQEPWNKRDFYVSLGEGDRRSWEDCRRYGFISGGGGRFHSVTLNALFAGARVFVNIPATGYVGVGEVTGTSTPVTEFKVAIEGREMPILAAPLTAPNVGDKKDDPELCEYMVPVSWIKAVPREQAYWEKGLFASQHTACRLRNQFTIERLTRHFGLED